MEQFMEFKVSVFSWVLSLRGKNRAYFDNSWSIFLVNNIVIERA